MLLLISEVVPPQFFFIPQKELFDSPTANIFMGALPDAKYPRPRPQTIEHCPAPFLGMKGSAVWFHRRV